MVIGRGQIFWCELDPVQGHEQGAIRPVVVISANPYNETRSPLVAIVPLTKSPPKTPVHVSLAPEESGLAMASTALIDHARFLDRSRLRGAPVGEVRPEALARLDRHLMRVLGLG